MDALDPDPVFTESTTILKSLLSHWDGVPLLDASLTPEDCDDSEQMDDSGHEEVRVATSNTSPKTDF